MDFVVPIAVELVALESDTGEFLVVDLGSGRVDTLVDFGMNLQPFSGGCGGDQIDYDLETEEWLSPPVLADEAEKPMLDFVPLAGSWRKVAYGDPHAGLVGQFL